MIPNIIPWSPASQTIFVQPFLKASEELQCAADGACSADAGAGIVGRVEGHADSILTGQVSQMMEHGLGPFGRVDLHPRAIHLIGWVVSLRGRAAMASLPGSLRRRVANSDSCQPRRASSSVMMRLRLCSVVSRWSSPEWLSPSLPSINSSICPLNLKGSPVDLQPLTTIQQNDFTSQPPPARDPITLTVCVTTRPSTTSRQHYFHRTAPLYMERRIFFATRFEAGNRQLLLTRGRGRVQPEVDPRKSSGTSSTRLTARPHRRLA